MLRSVLHVSWIRTLEYILKFVTINVYAAIPPGELGFRSPSWIYGFFPASPIRREDGGLYSEEWTFPTDYFLWQSFPEGTDIAVAVDGTGCTKAYEYDVPTSVCLLNSGWALTVTREGSIIYHGPRNDPRSEICIVVPFGYGLDGLDIGADLSVTNQIDFTGYEWERNDAFTRQVFNILYTKSSFIRAITQEVTWDTDTLIPCVKTTYTGEGVHRFDIKEFKHYWYQDGKLSDKVWLNMPVMHFSGARSSAAQMRLGVRVIDRLKVKYAAESNLFDKYRNPDLVP